MSATDPLGPEAVRAADPDGTLAEILDLAEHLRDALWRVQSANLAPRATPGGIQVVAVDGLELGAQRAREALIPRLGAPLAVFDRVPDRPAAPAAVLLASYDGEDAAVLGAFAATAATAATAAGSAEGADLIARRVVLGTGGALAAAARAHGVPVIPVPGGFPRPGLASAYALVACLELARLGGLVPVSAAEIEDGAAHVARLARAWGPDSGRDTPAKRIARAELAMPATPAGRRDRLGDLSVVEAGETPLQRAVTRILLDHLVDLYHRVLSAGS
ncbi:hypothetical protein [Conexibacter sp. DBS9H8]|uniref:hypothetical protein n=1 Tax=Conexibacter sp. DBS9H8 TaxID=2937801 RepID=UPI00200FFEDD|nr:hypothetical protein [Conexibacter sp. DBS9H8]